MPVAVHCRVFSGMFDEPFVKFPAACTVSVTALQALTMLNYKFGSASLKVTVPVPIASSARALTFTCTLMLPVLCAYTDEDITNTPKHAAIQLQTAFFMTVPLHSNTVRPRAGVGHDSVSRYPPACSRRWGRLN